MLKKTLIFIAIFIILLLIISRCSSNAPTPPDSFTDVTDGAGNAVDSAGNALGNASSAADDMAGSARDAAGNAVDSADNALDNAGSTAGDMAGSARDAAGNTVDSAMGKMTSSGIDLKGVVFEFNSSELDSSSFATLDAAISKINALNDHIEVAGFTDNIGSSSANKALSQKRANAVLNYFVSNGVDASRISAKGYGAQSPVADNSTQAGQRKNRRVELYIK